MLKSRRPAFNEHAHMQPNPLPGPDAAATKLDVYTKVSVLLKGKQNINLPSVGSKQYAIQSTLHSLSFSPSPLLYLLLPETAAHGIALSEGATSI